MEGTSAAILAFIHFLTAVFSDSAPPATPPTSARTGASAATSLHRARRRVGWRTPVLTQLDNNEADSPSNFEHTDTFDRSLTPSISKHRQAFNAGLGFELVSEQH